MNGSVNPTPRANPRWIVLAAICLVWLPVVRAQPSSLDLYFIDTEGGQSTLIVSPSGQSLLIDAGYPGDRDADRIAAAARLAGITRIDFLLITHHHRDHEGGVPDLLKRLPVGVFLDHGPSVESAEALVKNRAVYDTEAAYQELLKGLAPSRQSYDAYVEATAARTRRVLSPGDSIDMKGLDIRVVSSAGKVLPGAGVANDFCKGLSPVAEMPVWENPQSVGTELQFGRFRFVDLGDLTWNTSLQLFCPGSRIPPIDLFLSPHHGTGVTPQAEWALRPRVTIMNNGARKGGDPRSWQTLRHAPGLEDLWQLHYAIAGGAENNVADRFIANIDEQCEGHYLKVSALADGSFTVYNARTQETRRYASR